MKTNLKYQNKFWPNFLKLIKNFVWIESLHQLWNSINHNIEQAINLIIELNAQQYLEVKFQTWPSRFRGVDMSRHPLLPVLPSTPSTPVRNADKLQ